MEDKLLKTFTGGIKNTDYDSEEKESLIVWNKDSIVDVAKAIERGAKPKSSPFWQGDVGWRKGNIVYEYSKEELRELKKCKEDIVYFAEKYCYLMTGNGYRPITLRDYQKKLLNHLVKNEYNIVLAARQIGKCVVPWTEIEIKNESRVKRVPMFLIFKPSNIFDWIKRPIYWLIWKIS